MSTHNCNISLQVNDKIEERWSPGVEQFGYTTSAFLCKVVAFCACIIFTISLVILLFIDKSNGLSVGLVILIIIVLIFLILMVYNIIRYFMYINSAAKLNDLTMEKDGRPCYSTRTNQIIY
jgi:phosphoglycerol transferase MdoB-like AlkP superfamily enzyme